MEPLQSSSSFTVFLLLLLLALSVFLELFSMVNCKPLEQCLQKESSALLQLKRGFITSELDTWQPGTDCCFWVGVTCDESRRVTGLDLSDQSITGRIDPILFNLTSLETLNLSNNEFHNGSIPDSGWERLTNLSILSLSGALYIDKVPVGISRLTKLTSLDLSGNGYPLTANPIILQNMSNLRVLNLNYVNLSTYGVEWCGALANYTPALAVLRMMDSSLFGYFPNEIFFLRNLKELDLSNNQMLSGSLSDFPEYSNLETLTLYGTNFSGNLPDTIGNLKFLTDLNLGECQFSGKIPTSMGNLSRLKWLYLSDNNFSGTVPFFLPFSMISEPKHNGLSLSGANTCLNGNLCNLKELDLSDNSFSGPISASVFTLPALEKLQLQQNQFSGQLGEFSNASSMLTYVDLSNNKLQGQIPRSIFKLSGLQRLHLDSNNFSGVVGSEFIKGLKDLGWLSLSNNKLTEIPLFIKYQNNSFRLELSKNKLTGAIPTFFCNLTNLELLDLSDNKLIGSIPPCLLESSLESLAYLNYSSNNLTGEIPTFICNLNQLQTLDLSNNKLNGSIPPCLLKRSSLKALSYLDLSKNKLIGEIPTFICNLTNLEMLDLSDNKLTGSIPSCLFEEESSLLMLNLRGNQLYGAIPHGVTPNCKLQLINLRDNQLEGLLPRFLSNCRSLELLDLGNNNLKDVFPYWLGNISTLRVLILRSNKFYGLVGPLDGNNKTNYTFSALNVLDISSNKFSGNLSVICFSNFKSMMINPTDVMQSSISNLSDAYYSLVVLTIMDKGQIMMIQRFWTIIKSIDISNNYFEGEIPISIGELVSLQVLNLSQNHLIGKILPQLEHLLQLESLDLSMNNLSGKIPQELVSLHFLSFLNLSYNKLVGEIPSGGQFSTFSSASFGGNKGLCWHPCNTSVPAVNNKVPSLGGTTSENKSYKIVLGLLFGVGLGGSMAAVIVVDVMCCDRSRRWRNIRRTHE